MRITVSHCVIVRDGRTAREASSALVALRCELGCCDGAVAVVLLLVVGAHGW